MKQLVFGLLAAILASATTADAAIVDVVFYQEGYAEAALGFPGGTPIDQFVAVGGIPTDALSAIASNSFALATSDCCCATPFATGNVASSMRPSNRCTSIGISCLRCEYPSDNCIFLKRRSRLPFSPPLSMSSYSEI